MLCGDTRIKATYKRKYLIGGFLKASGGESMTIKVGNTAASRKTQHWNREQRAYKNDNHGRDF